MDSDVEVVYTKFDGSLSWNATLGRLGEDDHGVWLRAPAGPTWRRGTDQPVDFPGHVVLIPNGTWWTAKFNTEPAVNQLYCDITTVPVWQGRNRVTMVDLDLDVVRLRSTGQIELLDEDEFSARKRTYGYPVEVIAEATATAQALRRAICDEHEPFASHYRTWLSYLD